MKVFAIDILEQIENEIKQIEQKAIMFNLGLYEEASYQRGIIKGLKLAHHIIFEKIYEEEGVNYEIQI